jgi:hypothetical protein
MRGIYVGETTTESGLADSILRGLVDESVLFVTLDRGWFWFKFELENG